MALSDAVPFAVAAWALDEASGTRADSVGSNDLTDNNTVGSGTGKFDTAADFEADNSERLTSNDTADLSVSDIDFMWRLWARLESKGADRPLVTKWQFSSDHRSYHLRYDSGSDRFAFFVSHNGLVAVSVTANNFGSPSTGTWYLIHAWHDAANNQIGISVNAGTADTTSHGDGVFNDAGIFELGGWNDAGAWHDGLIDDVVLLKGYVLDATERAEDYNGGAGVAFADWDAGGAINANLLRGKLHGGLLLGGKL